MSAPVGVVGGGRFGQSLALAAANTGHEVVLVSRRPSTQAHAAVRWTPDAAALTPAELVFMAVPSDRTEEAVRGIGEHLDGRHQIVHVSRGLFGDDLEPVTQVVRRLTPVRRVGALAGPLVASALEEARPGGAIVGSRFPEIVEAVREAIGSDSLRVYSTADVIGVQLGSAMVGILTLAVGLCRSLEVGPAALATMVTRGMAEAARIGVALGGEERTFWGLAGIGDLTAVMAGHDRPELHLAASLARGAALQDACDEVGANVESVRLARRVARYAARAGIAAPLTDAVADVLDARRGVTDAVMGLMTRRQRAE